MKKSLTKNLLLNLALVTIVLLIYGRTAQFDFVPYDDPAYITENHLVNKGLSPEGIRWAFLHDSNIGDLGFSGVENLWHPLTWISHMIDAEIFGTENAGGHHIMNVVLFVLTSMLVMWCSKMLLGNTWAGFLFALLWILHPLKVESVAWVSERKDILSGLFFWASLSCVLMSFKGDKRWKIIAYGLFIAAMLSKPSMVILPAIILFVEAYLNEEKEWGVSFIINGLKRWWAWFASAGVVAVVTILMQSGGSHEFFIQHSSLASRMISSALALWFYLWRIILPINLAYEYEYPRLSSMYYLIAWVALIVTLFFIWSNREKLRTLFFGIAWFLICWLPVSGLVYVGASFTSDRYMYLALAGLLFPLVKALEKYKWGTVGVLSLCIFWSLLSWKQVGVWKDGWALFEHATKARPHSARAWINLGGMYQDDKQYDQAILCYQKSIEINPKSYLAWYNLGNIKGISGDLVGAEKSYLQALKIYPENLESLLNLLKLRYPKEK